MSILNFFRQLMGIETQVQKTEIPIETQSIAENVTPIEIPSKSKTPIKKEGSKSLAPKNVGRPAKDKKDKSPKGLAKKK